MSYEIQKPPQEERRVREAHEPLMPPALDLDVERSVRMYPMLVAAVALVVAGAIAFYGWRMKPVYTAKTTVYVQPISTKMLGDTAGYYDQAKYESYLQQQMLTAVRPDILAGALAKLAPGVWQRPGESVESAVARLEAAVKVARVQTSYEINFSVTAQDQAAVAPVANAVTDAFLKLGRKDELAQTDDRMQLLSDERDRISKELETARQEQRQLGSAIGVANTAATGGSNPYDLQLAELRTQLAGAREAHDVAAAQLQAVTTPGPTGLDAAADEALATDPTLSGMKSTISQKQGQLVNQMAGLTPNNPVYKESEAELQQLNRQLETVTLQMREKAARKLQDKLRLDLEKTGDVEARLNGQLARQTAAATTAAPKLQRSEDLAADVTRLQARFATVDDAMRSLAIESSSPGLAHLAVAAVPPAGPDSNRRGLLLAVALPIGLLIGLAAAVIANKQNRYVLIGKDVQQVLDFAPMAVLPSSADVSSEVLDEYVLRFAGAIDQAIRRGRARSYLLTAVSPTTEIDWLVRALAERMGQLGFRATLVSPSMVLDRPVGILGNGAAPTARSLSSSRTDHADDGKLIAHMESLQKGFDLLLIEGDPILASAETEYVARLADVTILIAEAGVTLRSELAEAAALLKRLSATGVGSVLTEVRIKTADRRFREAIAAMDGRTYAGPRPGVDWQDYRSGDDGGSSQPQSNDVPQWQEPEPEPVVVRPQRRRAADQQAQQVQQEPQVSTPQVVEREYAPVADAFTETQFARPVVEDVPVAAVHTVEVAAEETESVVETHAANAAYAATAAHAATAAEIAAAALSEQVAAAASEPVVEEPVVHEPTPFAQYAARLEASELLHPPVVTPNVAKIVESRIGTILPPLESGRDDFRDSFHAAEAAQGITPMAVNDDSVRRSAYQDTRAELVDPSELHFNPTPLAPRLAHRNDFAPEETTEKKPHRSWVHRIFRRDPEAAYSIAPKEETAAETYPAPRRLSAPTAAPEVFQPVRDTYLNESFRAMKSGEIPVAQVETLPAAQAAEVVPVAAAEPVIESVPTSLWDEAESAMSAGYGLTQVPHQTTQQVIDELGFSPVSSTVLADEEMVERRAVPRIAAAEEPPFEYPTAVHAIATSVPQVLPEVQERPSAALDAVEVSMPLVPMSTDYLDAGFDFGNELAAWRPLPLSEPQPMYDSYIRPADSSGERRDAYREAAGLREVEPVQVEEPVQVWAEEPVVVTGRAAPKGWAMSEASNTQVAGELKEVSPVRGEKRRFHLLAQFDKPAVKRGEPAEATQGGSR